MYTENILRKIVLKLNYIESRLIVQARYICTLPLSSEKITGKKATREQ
jgi:hypothetical protein